MKREMKDFIEKMKTDRNALRWLLFNNYSADKLVAILEEISKENRNEIQLNQLFQDNVNELITYIYLVLLDVAQDEKNTLKTKIEKAHEIVKSESIYNSFD